MSQENDVHLVLDFDGKTIDSVGEYIELHSVWDSENAGIVGDPGFPDKSNKVFMWTKNPEGQLWGGFIFRLFDERGIDLTTWENLKFRIRGTKPFNKISVKLQKPNEIGVFHSEIQIDGFPNTWHDIDIKLTDIIAPHNNPGYFMIFPAGGEDIHGIFYLDDLRFERPKLIPVADIIFNDRQLQLKKGDIRQLSPTFLPEDATNIKLVKWKSLNEDVVLVSSKGLISVVGKGEAEIKVDVAGVESSVKIFSE